MGTGQNKALSSRQKWSPNPAAEGQEGCGDRSKGEWKQNGQAKGKKETDRPRNRFSMIENKLMAIRGEVLGGMGEVSVGD